MRKPEWQQDLAMERMEILFGLAEKEYKKNPERSRRYAALAMKIGLRYNVRLPAELKSKFCKKCFTLLVPGKTLQTRMDSRTKTMKRTCLSCGSTSRHPYKQ